MAKTLALPETSTDFLTTTPLNLDPQNFTLATQFPFLVKAREGGLTKKILNAQAYLNFTGALITRVNLPSNFIFEDAKRSSLPWRVANLLSGSLENIHRELRFFADVARDYSLDLEQSGDGKAAFSTNEATAEYVKLFQSFGKDPKLTLLDGLVVLWATEQCYLSAWKYARSRFHDSQGYEDLDGGALRKEFIPNWTSDEFEKFVDEIADVTNLLAEQELLSSGRYEATWRHVLQIERDFWPEI